MSANGKSPILPILTGLGALGVVAGYFRFGPERFWANWLFWFLALFTLALGALFIVALEHLVGARWSVAMRRVPERISTLILPLVPVALISLGAVKVLYPGTRPEALKNPLLAGKAVWLSLPFFSLRTGLCLAFALLGLWIFVRGSFRQDATADPKFNVRAQKFAPGFMFLFALVVTVLAFDWVSGLTPEWYSDIFGVYLFAGGFLAGLAATAVGVLKLRDQGRLPGVKGDHLYNLGAFLFAFTVFWSYIGFAQYMLMWYANLPEELFWYKDRLAGSWHAFTIMLAILHFVIPFFALVTRDAKGDPRRLRWVAGLMIFAHLMDIYWLIFPTLRQGLFVSWIELSFLLAFGGGALLWIRQAMTWGKDMPAGDPFLREGLEFRL